MVAQRKVGPVLVTTKDIPARQQFDAWRSISVPYLDTAKPRRTPEDGFEATGRALAFGSFMFYGASLPAYDYSRSAARIRRDSLDHWIVAICRNGTQRQRSGDVEITMRPGTPYVFTMANQFEAKREGERIEWLSLFVARDAVPELEGALTASLYRPVEGALGGLLAGTIASISDVLDDLAPEDLPRLASATQAVLSAAMGTAAAGRRMAGPQVEHIQLARVKRLIRENIGAATLGPARLSAAAGMSRSQLYRLFEPLGGVARHIQRERLAVARRRLADPAEREGIARIAEAAGFFEPSTFSRAFRQEYGVSPREFRAAALGGEPAVPVRRGPGPQGAGLLEMLRGL